MIACGCGVGVCLLAGVVELAAPLQCPASVSNWTLQLPWLPPPSSSSTSMEFPTSPPLTHHHLFATINWIAQSNPKEIVFIFFFFLQVFESFNESFQLFCLGGTTRPKRHTQSLEAVTSHSSWIWRTTSGWLIFNLDLTASNTSQSCNPIHWAKVSFDFSWRFLEFFHESLTSLLRNFKWSESKNESDSSMGKSEWEWWLSSGRS